MHLREQSCFFRIRYNTLRHARDQIENSEHQNFNILQEKPTIASLILLYEDLAGESPNNPKQNEGAFLEIKGYYGQI